MSMCVCIQTNRYTHTHTPQVLPWESLKTKELCVWRYISTAYTQAFGNFMQAASKERGILENVNGFYTSEARFTKHNSKSLQYYGKYSQIGQEKMLAEFHYQSSCWSPFSSISISTRYNGYFSTF